MLYLWEIPECPNKHIAVYDEERVMDRFIFLDGIELSPTQMDKQIMFEVEVSRFEISRYQCIPNNSACPLVNQKVVDILLELASESVQFFEAQVQCRDGFLEGYQLLNVTKKIIGIDHEKSIYTKMKLADTILRFRYLTYKPNCMGTYKLARDEEYLGNLLVAEEIKRRFEKEKIKGVRFFTPEEYSSYI